MNHWKCSDGTTITQSGVGVVVTGTSALAKRLRSDLAIVAEGHAVAVPIVAPPGGTVPLRSDAWLVDRWVRARTAAHVESDYTAVDDDAPDDAKRLLKRDPGKPGVIY